MDTVTVVAVMLPRRETSSFGSPESLEDNYPNHPLILSENGSSLVDVPSAFFD
jgi:hypothetical protein